MKPMGRGKRWLASHCMHLLGVTIGAVWIRTPLDAQAVSQPSSAPTAVKSVSPAFDAFEVGMDAVDTAWIAVGHRNFAHYDTPSACVAATTLAREVANRGAHAIDTASYTPLTDTFPRTAVTIARQCGASFTVATTDPAELRALEQLELVRGNDRDALAAADRYIATWPDIVGKAWAMVAVVHDLMAVRPMRLVAAESLIQRLDALGPSVPVQRYVAHWDVWNYSRESFDVSRMEREGIALLAMAHLLKAETNNKEYGNVGRHERLNVGGAHGFLLGILEDLLDAEWMPGVTKPMAFARVEQLEKAAGMDPIAGRRLFETLVRLPDFDPFRGRGAVVSRLPGQWWFGAPGDTVWPKTGAVTVVSGVSANAGADAYKYYALFRHLHNRFGKDVKIVLHTKTQGYWKNSPPLTPAQEADTIRWYFMNYLKLPIDAITVNETHFTTLPDGRRVPMDMSHAFPSEYKSYAFIDKNKILLHSQLYRSRVQMDTVIRQAVSK